MHYPCVVELGARELVRVHHSRARHRDRGGRRGDCAR
jgi:hypothetical protein